MLRLVASLAIVSLAALACSASPFNQIAAKEEPKAAAVAPIDEISHAKHAPILESTKKLFVAAEQSSVVAQPQAAVAPHKDEAPVAASAAAAAVAPVVSAVVAPVVEAKKAVVAEQLPAQSERSAVQIAPHDVQPIVAERPVAPVVQPAVAPAIAAPVAPVVAAPKAAPVVEPVVEPVVVKPVDAPIVKTKDHVEHVPVPEALVAEPVVGQPQAPVAPIAVPVAPVVVPVAPVVAAKQPEQHQHVEVAQPAPVVEAAPIAAVKAADESLSGKKDESIVIVVPEPDPQLVLSQPIDSTTKLLVDLDEHVQKFLPAEDKVQDSKEHAKEHQIAGVDYSPAQPTGKSSAGGVASYASNNGAVVVDDAIVPPLPASIEGVEKASGVQSAAAAAAAPASGVAGSVAPAQQSSAPSASRQAGQSQNQQQVVAQLIDQLDALNTRIQDTITQLQSRRRYVMSALLRPMGTYVRRVRTNLERLQTRVNQLQAAATSVGGQNRPGGFIDEQAINAIRVRINDISKRISDIVNGIRFSLTPTSAPLSSNGRRK